MGDALWMDFDWKLHIVYVRTTYYVIHCTQRWKTHIFIRNKKKKTKSTSKVERNDGKLDKK